ncbi:MAG TPA: MarR family transcriptional regulator [Gaiellaceae bacterium]|jgi:DNA-binding MarR family transcriptional regulator
MPTAVAADPVAVANRLRPVLFKLNRALRRELHSLGVTGGQVSLLVQISKQRGIGVGELATLEGMSAPGMSKYVGRLEREGLVVRGSVGGDRRRIGLSLTESGERVLRSVRSRRTAWLAARLRELEPAEIDAIDAAIEPLTRLLEVEA